MHRSISEVAPAVSTNLAYSSIDRELPREAGRGLELFLLEAGVPKRWAGWRLVQSASGKRKRYEYMVRLETADVGGWVWVNRDRLPGDTMKQKAAFLAACWDPSAAVDNTVAAPLYLVDKLAKCLRDLPFDQRPNVIFGSAEDLLAIREAHGTRARDAPARDAVGDALLADPCVMQPSDAVETCENAPLSGVVWGGDEGDFSFDDVDFAFLDALLDDTVFV